MASIEIKRYIKDETIIWSNVIIIKKDNDESPIKF